MFSLKYCKYVINLLFWVLLGMPDYVHPNLYYQFVEMFAFIFRQKINFIPYAFLEILQGYANLFWVLSASMVIHSQNYSINLYKTLMFISMPKRKSSSFTSSLGFYILNNPELLLADNMSITEDPEFCQIWDKC